MAKFMLHLKRIQPILIFVMVLEFYQTIKSYLLFKKNSNILNICNGVGSLTNDQIRFAIAKKEMNFYDFAEYFKKLGCKNALYLDGFVSRTYLPEKNWEQIDGNFGVIIGVTE